MGNAQSTPENEIEKTVKGAAKAVDKALDKADKTLDKAAASVQKEASKTASNVNKKVDEVVKSLTGDDKDTDTLNGALPVVLVLVVVVGSWLWNAKPWKKSSDKKEE